MKFLVLGGNGQLGRAFRKEIRDGIFVDIEDLDLCDKKALGSLIKQVAPDVVINCAAFTDVEGAEDRPEEAVSANSGIIRNISDYFSGKIVHFSTDYVFDGTKGLPYEEGDEPNPLSVYGRSKLDGEKILMSSANDYLIVRTSWLFGDGKNFVRAIGNLLKEKESLTVIDDQIGSPTYTEDLASAVMKLISSDAPNGIYHLSNEGECSWFEFATEVRNLSERSAEIVPVKTSQYKQRALRPAYSPLKNHKAAELGIKLPHWKDSLARYLEKVAHL